MVQKVLSMPNWRRLPWTIGGLTLLAALLMATLQPGWLRTWGGQALIWALVLGGLIILYWTSQRILALTEETRRLHSQVQAAERQVGKAYQRLNAIFRISHKFVEASDESEVVELVLRLAMDVIGAVGASFVPLDEHGQPLTAISRGEMPFPVMNDWVEYLASPAVRNRCNTCVSHGKLREAGSCPLVRGPFSDAIGLYCLPLKRGEREFGVLNLFLPNVDEIDPETQSFLSAMLDETALALEGVRLRRQELATLRQMRALREKADLRAILTSLLEDIQQTLEADFALLRIEEKRGDVAQVAVGIDPSQMSPFIQGILRSVIASGEPVLLGDVTGETTSGPGVRSLMATPLYTTERTTVGVLLVGNRRKEGFNQRQLPLLQTVASQVGLAVQNANEMNKLEYKTVIQERTRLAREIHDGLAQTLGFLKLQMAQLRNYLDRHELERARETTNLCYTTISDAYQDARQAIDGLRISPSGSGLAGWLRETVAEFEESSGLAVDLDEVDVQVELPPEVHAQLIRIVQEALNNIRKHAKASQVWVSCREISNDLWLEIRDDGGGFAPEDIPGPSQHGLRGMRERAELIGADFQVVSRPEEGTRVRVRLPLIGTFLLDLEENNL